MQQEQEFFNRVWDHFIIKRSRPSFDIAPDGMGGLRAMPRYCAEDGAACAIGIGLPEGSYTPCMEDYTVVQLVGAAKQIAENLGASITNSAALWFFNFDLEFLEELQECHDDAVYATIDTDPLTADFSAFYDYLETSMRELAQKWNFSIPEVKELALV